jgi:oligopeptidase A
MNPLIVPIQSFVDYKAIRPEHIEASIPALLAKARAAVDLAAREDGPATWECVVDAVDEASEPLWRAWSIAGHLNSVVNTTELRNAYNAMLPAISEYSTWVGLHAGLYKKYKLLKESAQFSELSSERQRVVELSLRDFKLSGVELQDKARDDYAANAEKQAQVSQKFSENVLDATDAWTLKIDNIDRLAGVPSDVLESIKDPETASWALNLKMPCYLPVMQYAQDRELRRTLYHAYATRASEQGDIKFDNSALIEESLSLRAQEAKLLGFQHYAELRLQTRMAKSAGEVGDFLRQLTAKAKPFAQRDLAELTEFARAALNLTDLQPWDIAFISERLRESRYDYSEDEVKQYFTEPRVLKGLFNVIETLFHVELIEHPVSGWCADVRCYAVKGQEGKTLGYLLMDLYARPGKQGGAWVDSERSRHRVGNEVRLPITYLTCNFAQPQGLRPAVWTHDDVITLFHESGHALHALLSEVDELGVSAFSSVEWDAIELPSQFMENFCWDWKVLQGLSAHVDTGQPIPRSLYDKMTAARNFQSGMQTVRQVEFSLFDVLIHQQHLGLSIAQVMSQLDQVRQEVAVLLPPSWHRFPHSFSHLFAGGYGAGYYSYKWAEVLSADAYEAFEEAIDKMPSANRASASTLDPDTGLRFRREILAVGGARPAAESFKSFRGREPKLDALLRHHGMTPVPAQHRT